MQANEKKGRKPTSQRGCFIENMGKWPQTVAKNSVQYSFGGGGLP